MFIQTAEQKPKGFTITTFSNDEALVKERRNHKLSSSTYAKEQTYAVLRAVIAGKNTSPTDTRRKESYK